MRFAHIYVLRDPRTLDVRYVGKTIQPLRDRLGAHMRRCKQLRTHRDCWIKGLLDAGIKPVIEEIETASGDWETRERFWIAYYRKHSRSLTNQTEGGEGVDSETASKGWSPERRARQSKMTTDMNKRRPSVKWSKERRLLQSEAQKKRFQNPSQRLKMAQAMRTAVDTPGYRERMSKAVARAWTPERRQRQSEIAARLNARRWGHQ